MLLCDACGTGWHMECLQPPLSRPPRGLYLCPTCTGAGVTIEDVEALRKVAAERDALSPPSLAPAEERKAASLHGRLVKRRWQKADYVGRLEYLQPGQRQRVGWPLAAVFESGNKEHLSIRMAEKSLLPVEHPAPPGLRAAFLARPQDKLPDWWDLRDRKQLSEALQLLMPGPWH